MGKGTYLETQGNLFCRKYEDRMATHLSNSHLFQQSLHRCVFPPDCDPKYVRMAIRQFEYGWRLCAASRSITVYGGISCILLREGCFRIACFSYIFSHCHNTESWLNSLNITAIGWSNDQSKWE